MRSDFYALPWAARQAIRKGEARIYTIQELEAENRRLRARIAELEAASNPIAEESER